MIQRLFLKSLFLICILCLTITASATALSWQTLAPGLQYSKYTPPSNSWFSGSIHIFRFNLRRYKLALLMAQDYKRQNAPVEYFAEHSAALVAVNGGFFSPSFKPLGLRVQNGKTRTRLRQISWWGVFYTRGQHAYVVAQRSFRYRRGITFAVQSGPRLLVNGRIPPLKNGKANRTALGVTRNGSVVFVVTKNLPMTTTELAQFMRKSTAQGGLNCINALNMDGGPSSQLYSHIGDFVLSIPNFNAVTDAVVVLPRNS